MTIAVGIVGPGFLVIGADSQEGWSPEVTLGTSKVSAFSKKDEVAEQTHSAAVVVTGAGSSDYLRYLHREVIKVAEDLPFDAGGHFLERFETALREMLVEFYEVNYLPFAVEAGNENMRTDLIIGAQYNDERALFRTFRNTMQRSFWAGIVTVGAGAFWAESATRNMIAFIAGETAATLTAAYAIFAAKEHTEVCGKETQLFALRSAGDLFVVAHREAIREAEAIFEKYEGLQRELLQGMVTPGSIAYKTDADARIAALREELRRVKFYD